MKGFMKPHVGQRVRRTAPHKRIPIGMLGTIDVVHKDGSDFWVVTDDGGFCGWTCFDAWAPVEQERTAFVADEGIRS